jgi:hypothetical protein
VRGSLIWLGCADPVESTDTLAEEDPDAVRRATVFEALAATLDIEERGYTVAEMIKQTDQAERLERDDERREALAKQLLHGLAEVAWLDKQLNGNKLGNWLRHNRNRRSGGRKLVMLSGGHRIRWKLEDAVGDPDAADRDEADAR